MFTNPEQVLEEITRSCRAEPDYAYGDNGKLTSPVAKVILEEALDQSTAPYDTSDPRYRVTTSLLRDFIGSFYRPISAKDKTEELESKGGMGLAFAVIFGLSAGIVTYAITKDPDKSQVVGSIGGLVGSMGWISLYKWGERREHQRTVDLYTQRLNLIKEDEESWKDEHWAKFAFTH